MSNPGSPESRPINEPNESFKDILSQFEQSKSRKAEEAGKALCDEHGLLVQEDGTKLRTVDLYKRLHDRIRPKSSLFER